MSAESLDSLKKTLDEHQEWPCVYMFKFIARKGSLDPLLAALDDLEVRTRPSSKGNYTSVTAHVSMESSDEVIDIYRRAMNIPGVMTL